MNTSFLRIKKAVAAFALGSLLATFAATPIALADSHPDWARGDDMNVGATQANRCEALAIALLNAGYESTEADAEAASNFEDIEGQCQQDVGLGVQLGAINAEGKTMYNGDALVQRTEFVLMITRLLQDEMDARILAGEEVADLSETHTAELEASTHSGWDTKVFSTDAEGNEVELDMFQVWARSIHFNLIKGENNGEFLNPEGALNGYQASTVADRAAESFELTEEYSSAGTETEGPDDEEEPTDEETTPEVEADGGDLTVSLSDNSPESSIIYSNAAAASVTPNLAVFRISASSENTEVDGLMLSINETTTDTLSGIALFSEEGKRLTNSRSFNSDDEANLNFLNEVTIDSGEYIDVYVRGSVTANKEGRFSLSVKEVTNSNASSVSMDDASAAQHKVELSSKLGTLAITEGSSSSDVSVGEQDVEVLDFNMEASSEDVTINSITLESVGTADLGSDYDSLVLFIDGEQVSEGVNSGDFVTFELESSFELEEDNDEYDATIKASIKDGAGDNIKFELDSVLDVKGYTTGQNGLAVTSTLGATNATTVEAGEISVVELDTPYEEITKDRKDNVLAAYSVISNAGEGLEIQKIGFTITDTADKQNGGNDLGISNTLTEVEVLLSKKAPYIGSAEPLTLTDGAAAAANVATAVTNSTFTEGLESGETLYITLIADTKDTDLINGVKYQVSIDGLGGAKAASDLYIEGDNVSVSDITPSGMTFETVDGKLSSATATPRAQTDPTVVVGSDVNIFHFELEAGSSSDVTFEEFVFTGTVVGGGAAFNSSVVNNVRLYKGDEELESLGGSNLSGNTATFRDFSNFTVDADEKVQMHVYVDLKDNDANNGATVNLALTSAKAKDSKNKTVAVNAATSNRTVELALTGTLAVAADNLSQYSDSSVLLQGGYSPVTTNEEGNIVASNPIFVAAFDFQADREAITVNDLDLKANISANADRDVKAALDVDAAAGDVHEAAADAHIADYLTDHNLIAADVALAEAHWAAGNAELAAGQADFDAAEAHFDAAIVDLDAARVDADAAVVDYNLAKAHLTDYTDLTVAQVTAYDTAVAAYAAAEIAIDAAETAADVQEAAAAAAGTAVLGAAATDLWEVQVAAVLAQKVIVETQLNAMVAAADAMIVSADTAFAAASAALPLESYIDTAYLFHEDDLTTPIAYESAGSNGTISFDNISGLVVPDGEATVYLAVSTQRIGENLNGLENDFTKSDDLNSTSSEEIEFTVTVTDARGANTIANPVESSRSNGLVVSALDLDINWVASAGSENVDTVLKGNNKAGILEVSVADTVNTSSTGNDLSAYLTELKVFTDILDASTISAATIRRIGGKDAAAAGAGLGGAGDKTVTFDVNAMTNDRKIQAGQTVYYVIEIGYTENNAAADGDFIRLSFANVSSDVTFESDGTNAVKFNPRSTTTNIFSPVSVDEQ